MREARLLSFEEKQTVKSILHDLGGDYSNEMLNSLTINTYVDEDYEENWILSKGDKYTQSDIENMITRFYNDFYNTRHKHTDKFKRFYALSEDKLTYFESTFEHGNTTLCSIYSILLIILPKINDANINEINISNELIYWLLRDDIDNYYVEEAL